MLTIIDYGMGNLRSIQKIFQRLQVEVQITSAHSDILKAEKLLLPGIGHFANGIKKLKDTGLKEILNKKVLEDKTPIMGICLGMQLMTNYSEEGDAEGLGWIDAQTKKFNFASNKLKIPHMGWNQVEIKKNTAMTHAITKDDLFYFVHSYFVSCNYQEDILFQSDYGQSFVSGFEKENIVGIQFHPEKSHRSGMQLIQNFSNK
ncbi:MAG: imidazole glycerol phosphate synthase subunit HisH [Bacteroidota bacterium]